MNDQLVNLNYLYAAVNNSTDQTLKNNLESNQWRFIAMRELSGDVAEKAVIDNYNREAAQLDGPQLRERFMRLHNALSSREQVVEAPDKYNPAIVSAVSSLIATLTVFFIGNQGLLKFLESTGAKNTPAAGAGGVALPSSWVASEGNNFVIYIVQLAITIVFASMVYTRYGIKSKNPNMIPEGAIAKKCFDQFRHGWFYVWLIWALFYLWLSIQSGLCKMHPALFKEHENLENYCKCVAEVLNVCSGLAFFFCFLILDLPSVRTDTNPGRDRKFVRSLGYAAACGLTVLAFSVGVKLAHYNEDMRTLGEFFTAGFTGIGMLFLFGRLDSHIIATPRIMLSFLYAYGLIQPLYAVFSTLPDVLKSSLFIIVLILKILAWFAVDRFVAHGDLKTYLEFEIKDNFPTSPRTN